MQITVLRKVEYNNYQIYVMQFGWVFQYLFANSDGDIHQDNVILKPSLLRRVVAFLQGKSAYTEEDLKAGEEAVLSGAMASIDMLDEPVNRKARKRQKKVAANAKCMWQTINADHDPHYF